MPFLQLHNHNKLKENNSTAYSLRTCLEILHHKKLIKRASPFTSWKLKASMTVEAAFALPCFLFFLINVMSAMNMIGIQSRLSAALHQTGNEMAFAGYAYEMTAGDLLPDGIASVALTELYARNQIVNYVGKKYLDQSCIKNGTSGISFDGSSIMNGNDMIDISLHYQMEPLFSIPGFNGLPAGQRYFGRAWTGYDVESSVSDLTQEDPMVYITETGTVYHTNRDCTYLKPSIEAIDVSAIADSRNQGGGKYYPCEICGQNNAQGTVYITKQGSSYHSSITCSGLKRTIYTIPLSQVGGRGLCSKCR